MSGVRVRMQVLLYDEKDEVREGEDGGMDGGEREDCLLPVFLTEGKGEKNAWDPASDARSSIRCQTQQAHPSLSDSSSRRMHEREKERGKQQDRVLFRTMPQTRGDWCASSGQSLEQSVREGERSCRCSAYTHIYSLYWTPPDAGLPDLLTLKEFIFFPSSSPSHSPSVQSTVRSSRHRMPAGRPFALSLSLFISFSCITYFLVYPLLDA